jgi:hypothetical protein
MSELNEQPMPEMFSKNLHFVQKHPKHKN